MPFRGRCSLIRNGTRLRVGGNAAVHSRTFSPTIPFQEGAPSSPSAFYSRLVVRLSCGRRRRRAAASNAAAATRSTVAVVERVRRRSLLQYSMFKMCCRRVLCVQSRPGTRPRRRRGARPSIVGLALRAVVLVGHRRRLSPRRPPRRRRCLRHLETATSVFTRGY